MPACVYTTGDHWFRLFFLTERYSIYFLFEKSSARFNLIFDDICLSILFRNHTRKCSGKRKKNRMCQIIRAQANKDFHFLKKWRGGYFYSYQQMMINKLDSTWKNLLKQNAEFLVQRGKGILAADETPSSLTKRFHAIDVENTSEQRRIYRQILFTTPDIHRYLTGVIMHEETFYQSNDSSIPFPMMLTQIGILPGIKLDRVFIFDQANQHLIRDLLTIGVRIIGNINQ